MPAPPSLLAQLPDPGRVLYADFDDLYDEIREETLIRGLDFDQDGQVDVGPANKIRIGASVDIDSAITSAAGVYPMPIPGPPFPFVIHEVAIWGMRWRLALKIKTLAVHFEFYFNLCKERLALLRTGRLALDAIGGQTPPIAKNHGGALFPTGPFVNGQCPPVFANNGTGKWGLF